MADVITDAKNEAANSTLLTPFRGTLAQMQMRSDGQTVCVRASASKYPTAARRRSGSRWNVVTPSFQRRGNIRAPSQARSRAYPEVGFTPVFM